MAFGPLGILAAFASVASTQPSASPSPEVAEKVERYAHPALVAETTKLIPGKVNRIGITFEIEPGWHLYWNGQNDTGFPITTELVLPSGFTAQSTLWPAPERHVAEGDILDYVYYDRVTLVVPIDVPATATGKITLAAKIDWLVCKEACIPESAEVNLVMEVAANGETPAQSPHAALFKAADARLPKPLPPDSAVTVERRAESVLVKATGAKELAFFPGTGGVAVEDPIQHAAAKGDELRFRVREDDPAAARLIGVLKVVRTAGKPEYFQIDTDR